jgi:TPR repeat protein
MAMRFPFMLAAGIVASGSCGAPTAQKLRPDDPNYAAASGQRCIDGDGNPQPLIVDWKAESRADLEVTMRRGVAVVAYDCKALRVLPDCTLDGNYSFIGVSFKEQKLQLKTTGEIKANLPSGIIALSASAELKQGAALDVALSIVGKQTSSILNGTTQQLKGRCQGATHFVRAVTTGAFTLDTNTNANVDAQAAVYGAGASTKGNSEKQWHQKDGDPAACRTADPSATAAPAGCGAPLRLDLVAIAAPANTMVAAQTNADGGARQSSYGACPTGLVWSGNVCSEPRTDRAHRCKKDNADDCKRQCELGDAGSCSDLGFMHLVGRYVPLDRSRAMQLFEKACEGADPWGCNNVGAMLIVRDALPIAEARRALSLLETTCASEPSLCNNLAVANRDGRHTRQNKPRATELFSRSCLGGDAAACHDLALAYDDGIGVNRDVPRAAELQGHSCNRGFMHACAAMGTRYLYGTGVPKNEEYAVRYFRHACDGKNQLGCGLLGLMMMGGEGGLRRDPQGGKNLMEQACNSGSNDSCAILGAALKSQGDLVGARQWFDRACEKGMKEHCR